MSKIEIDYYTRRRKQALGFIDRLTKKYEEKRGVWSRDIIECDKALHELWGKEAQGNTVDSFLSVPEKAPEPRHEDDLASICDREAKG